MPTDLCINLMPDSLAEIKAVAELCEHAGVHSIGIADSPMLARDLYITCAGALEATDRLGVMSAVTNPVTRHPSVMAAAAVTLNEIAPGRVTIGMATGDSALWGVGLRPARVAQLREYIVALRALMRAEEATWQGATFRARWKSYDPSQAPKVLVAVSSPKVLEAAAQVSDGLIIAMGHAPEDITHIESLIDKACADVNRDRSELEVWWYTDINFAKDYASGLAMSLDSTAQWLVMGSTDGKRIPEGYVPLLKELFADAHDLETSYRDDNRGYVLVERAKQLGVYEWLASRQSGLCGTPEDVARRLAELRTKGLEKWCIWRNPDNESLTQYVEHLGEVCRWGG